MSLKNDSYYLLFVGWLATVPTLIHLQKFLLKVCYWKKVGTCLLR